MFRQSVSISRIRMQPQRVPQGIGRCMLSTSNRKLKKPTNEAERMEYLREANVEMQKYEEARELMRRGKLRPKKEYSDDSNTTLIQGGIFGLFLVCFFSTPFLGKKIAQDEEFRNKWIPSWYDFTVKKPEKAWTREELHEQFVAVEKDIHERAIRGEFTPEKLQEMRTMLLGGDYPHRAGIDRSKVPKEWDLLHPGLEEGEQVNEND